MSRAHSLISKVGKPLYALISAAARVLPDVWFCRVMFILQMHQMLHLKSPRTYSEKIQWIKLYGHLDRYVHYVDKYEVRRFVANAIGDEFLVPLIGIWESFDDIVFDALPEQFVLKATHGAGYNFICRDKSLLDLASLRRTVGYWMSRNYYRNEREPQYRSIRPRLVVEAYLEDDSGQLRDYKFTCFGGTPYMLEVISDRAHDKKDNLYDRQWNLLPVRAKGLANTATPIAKPTLLEDMFAIAGKLSAGFAFVRVDLYYVQDRIYFGELTFTPGNGAVTYEPDAFTQELGRRIDLSKFA